MLQRLKQKYIGDRRFYRMVLAVAVPIMVQNGITNFVSLLDNIMVGQCGTEQMSGVAIVNQIMFVYYLLMFGGLSGAGIFTAQYYGQRDDEGVRATFRYKLWLAVILNLTAFLVLFFYGSDLISFYLSGSDDGGDPAAAQRFGEGYLAITLTGLPALLLQMTYASTLRECGETVMPMKAGIVAVLINLIFNYLLIYGKFGFPELGVNGAALATVISRYVEMLIVVIYTHAKKKKHTFAQGLYKTLGLPLRLAGKVFVTGMPLMINEALWAAGIAMLTQCYSTRGLNVVAAQNIANTINNIFNIVFIALGDAVAIIIGQLLGAGKMEKAKDTDNKIIAFSVWSSVLIALLMFATSPFFPKIYNTTEEAKLLATRFLMLQALFMPQNAFLHTTYFTLRSGGRTIITFLFDSAFMWVVSVPIAFYLSRFTDWPVLLIFVMVSLADLIKCVVGYIMVKKNIWMNNIVVTS